MFLHRFILTLWSFFMHIFLSYNQICKWSLISNWATLRYIKRYAKDKEWNWRNSFWNLTGIKSNHFIIQKELKFLKIYTKKTKAILGTRRHFYSQNYLSLFRNLTENKWLNVLETGTAKSFCLLWQLNNVSYRTTALIVTEADEGRWQLKTRTLKLRPGVHLWSSFVHSDKSVWSTMISLLQKSLKRDLISFSLRSVLEDADCLNIQTPLLPL